MVPTRYYLLPSEDGSLIQDSLRAEKRLITCLCADWCSSCQQWKKSFSLLAKEYPSDCFVWLDIDEHPDMVAEVDLDVMPVLLLQSGSNVDFLGAIRPNIEVVTALINRASSSASINDPGIQSFLME